MNDLCLADEVFVPGTPPVDAKWEKNDKGSWHPTPVGPPGSASPLRSRVKFAPTPGIALIQALGGRSPSPTPYSKHLTGLSDIRVANDVQVSHERIRKKHEITSHMPTVNEMFPYVNAFSAKYSYI